VASGDGSVDQDLVAAITAALTMSASPVLLDGGSSSASTPMALLVLVPSVQVWTLGDEVGAELVDVISTSLMQVGFAALRDLSPMHVRNLLRLDDWHGVIRRADSRMTITEPRGVFFDGDVGPRPPCGWHDAIRSHGEVVLLVRHGDGRPLDQAPLPLTGRDRVVAARIPVATATWKP
jgi:hypothetical protein